MLSHLSDTLHKCRNDYCGEVKLLLHYLTFRAPIAPALNRAHAFCFLNIWRAGFSKAKPPWAWKALCPAKTVGSLAQISAPHAPSACGCKNPAQAGSWPGFPSPGTPQLQAPLFQLDPTLCCFQDLTHQTIWARQVFQQPAKKKSRPGRDTGDGKRWERWLSAALHVSLAWFAKNKQVKESQEQGRCCDAITSNADCASKLT